MHLDMNTGGILKIPVEVEPMVDSVCVIVIFKYNNHERPHNFLHIVQHGNAYYEICKYV